jgi:hypothetical protein
MIALIILTLLLNKTKNRKLRLIGTTHVAAAINVSSWQTPLNKLRNNKKTVDAKKTACGDAN